MIEGDLVFRSGFDATEAMEAHISDLNFEPRAEQNSAHPKLQGCRKNAKVLVEKGLRSLCYPLMSSLCMIRWGIMV